MDAHLCDEITETFLKVTYKKECYSTTIRLALDWEVMQIVLD